MIFFMTLECYDCQGGKEESEKCGNKEVKFKKADLARVNGGLGHVQVGMGLNGHGLVGVVLADILVDLCGLQRVPVLITERKIRWPK